MVDSVSSDYTVVKINKYSGLQQCTVSHSLCSPNDFCGFPYENMACFLGALEIAKVPANILASSISRIILPVDH